MCSAVSIPVLFAAQVVRAPDAVAVSFEGCSMSYRDLDEASDRLAFLLIECGAGPGERVAVLLPRSAEAVVAVLAVLKSGAAYVPVDAMHPDARIRFMLADAAPVVVVSASDVAGRVADCGVPLVDIADLGVTGGHWCAGDAGG